MAGIEMSPAFCPCLQDEVFQISALWYMHLHSLLQVVPCQPRH